MFRIEMLPAQRGDALWIEYGKASKPNRVLIDSGIQSTSKVLRDKIEALPKLQRRFDLLVITHIDLDHINGMLALLTNPPEGLTFDNVLFNGWKHLLAAEKIQETGTLGSKMGEKLTKILEKRGWNWNADAPDNIVAIRNSGKLPVVELSGGMKLTLLSPTLKRLKDLRPVWEKEIVEAGMKLGTPSKPDKKSGHPDDESTDPGLLGESINIDKLAARPVAKDSSKANGSSIAVLAEFGGKRCALLGDAYPSDITDALGRVAKEEGEEQVEVDAVKLSHHGGEKNTSNEMLQMMRCRNYLVSTSGANYKHPKPESVARVLVHGRSDGKPRLIFNYESEQTKVWNKKSLFKGDHPYEPIYPDGKPGNSISL